MTRADCLSALTGEADLVATRLADADLDAPVPHCPGWTVADLVSHLGGVHRWVTEVVRTRAAAEFPAAAASEELLAWFRLGARSLVDELSSLDPDSACWTFAPPRTVGFWSRRQLHETAMHRIDLDQAMGRAPSLDNAVAVDGVDEVVEMLFPRQVRLGRLGPLPAVLTVVERTTGRQWLLAGDGSRPTPPGAETAATVTGDGVPLLLLLWRRATLDDVDVQVEGDASVARHVLAQCLTP